MMKLFRLGRRIIKNGMAAFIRLLFGKKETEFTDTDVKKVLLVKLDNRLGNNLLISPMIGQLKQRYPECTIELITHKKMVRVHKHNPHVAKIYALDKHKPFSRDGWIGILKTLRKQQYQVVIDCSHPTSTSLTHGIFCRLIKASFHVAPRNSKLSALFTIRVPIPDDVKSERLQLLYLLKPLGIDSSEETPIQYFSGTVTDSPADQAVLTFVKQLSERSIALNLGAGSSKRILPDEFYEDLISIVADNNYHVVLLYGPQESAYAENIQNKATGNCILAPETNLDQFCFIVKHCQAVISNDTGPMHLAVACQVPTLGIFTITDSQRFGHNYAPHLVWHIDNMKWSHDQNKEIIAQFLSNFHGQNNQ